MAKADLFPKQLDNEDIRAFRKETKLIGVASVEYERCILFLSKKEGGHTCDALYKAERILGESVWRLQGFEGGCGGGCFPDQCPKPIAVFCYGLDGEVLAWPTRKSPG